MNASIVELRYKTREILKALDKRERVNILYHGKLKGVILPAAQPASKTQASTKNHPFFGMARASKEPVQKVMERLRGGRTRDF